MISKAEIHHIRKLQSRKYRQNCRQFVVEGVKLISALQATSELKLCTLYTTDNKNSSGILISKQTMSRISHFSSPGTMLAVFEIPSPPVIDQHTLNHGFTLVLDRIQDPGNLGAIIRSAAWFGIKLIICSDSCVDLYNSKTLQASMGAFVIPTIVYTNLEELLSLLPQKIPVYGTYMNGENYLSETFSEKRGIILIGNEGAGLNPNLEQFVTHRLHIPIHCPPNPLIESLNVSTATALILQKIALS